jgi:hypothetical protein
MNSVNAAAVAAGANLPAEEANRLRERINKRALRERWLDHAEALVQSIPTNALPLSKPVQTGADLLQNALKEDSSASKIGFSRAARKAAEHLAEQEPETILKHSRQMQDTAKTAALVHGWAGTAQGSGTSVNIALLTGQVAVQYNSQE